MPIFSFGKKNKGGSHDKTSDPRPSHLVSRMEKLQIQPLDIPTEEAQSTPDDKRYDPRIPNRRAPAVENKTMKLKPPAKKRENDSGNKKSDPRSPTNHPPGARRIGGDPYSGDLRPPKGSAPSGASSQQSSSKGKERAKRSPSRSPPHAPRPSKAGAAAGSSQQQRSKTGTYMDLDVLQPYKDAVVDPMFYEADSTDPCWQHIAEYCFPCREGWFSESQRTIWKSDERSGRPDLIVGDMVNVKGSFEQAVFLVIECKRPRASNQEKAEDQAFDQLVQYLEYYASKDKHSMQRYGALVIGDEVKFFRHDSHKSGQKSLEMIEGRKFNYITESRKVQDILEGFKKTCNSPRRRT